MIKSMTGYGRAVETVNGREFSVEIRSVNNRFLDQSVHLPRTLTFAEEAVKSAVKAAVSRGKVDVFVSVRCESGAEAQVTLNTAMVEGYLAAAREMEAKFGLTNDMTVAAVSRLPEVFAIDKPQVDEEQLQADLLSVVAKSLEAYNAMRTTEGKALAQDLYSRGQTILEMVSLVEQGSVNTVSAYRTRLETKIREVLENRELDEARIITEAAIFADKIAVDEETVRLRSHINQMNSLLELSEPIGQKLNFLLQEMNRETNTIGSKCSDLELTKLVVTMKAELEKIREQTQNIE